MGEKLSDKYAASLVSSDDIDLEKLYMLPGLDRMDNERYATLDFSSIGKGIQKYFTIFLGLDSILDGDISRLKKGDRCFPSNPSHDQLLTENETTQQQKSVEE